MNFRKRKILPILVATFIRDQFAKRVVVRLVLINERVRRECRSRDRIHISSGSRENRRLFHRFSCVLSSLSLFLVLYHLLSPSFRLFFPPMRISLSKTYRRGFFSASVIYQSPSFAATPAHSIHTDPAEDLAKKTRRR